MLGYIHEDYQEDYGEDYSYLEGGILDTIKDATKKLWDFLQPKVVINPKGTPILSPTPTPTYTPAVQVVEKPVIPNWVIYGGLILAGLVLIPKLKKQ